MYYISILIDNRKYQVVKLRPVGGQTNEDSFVPSFVIERGINLAKPLVAIAHEAILVHHGGFEADCRIDWSMLAVEQNGDQLAIQLVQASAETPEKDLPAPGTVADFKFENVDHRLEYIVQHSFVGNALTILLEATIGGQQYAGKVLLHLVPQQQIFDVVMDFGSEASQIVYHRRQKRAVFNRMNLVGNLLDYYYPSLKSKALHQETDDKELYRSAFFVRKEEAEFDPTEPPGKKGEYELLNLLTDRAQTDILSKDNVLVSNLKLAHLGAYNFPIKFKSATTNAFGVSQHNFSDAVVRLQQAIINYFLQTVLEEIRRSTRQERPLYLVIKLLVPNVFEQSKIAKIIYGTQTGLQQIAAKNPALRLEGVEISTLSESDASFLGYKVSKDEEVKYGSSFLTAGKRYLVIDVGKGTTDFSILEVHGKSKQLSSLYRSGFIGAGNVISYAFIDTIFTALVGTSADERQRVIFSILKRSDISSKLRFTEIIDKLKTSYHQQRKYKKIAEFINDRDELLRKMNDPNEIGVLDTLSALLERVHQQQGSILDEYGIIIDTVNELANRIHRQVDQSGAFRDKKTQEVLVVKLILTGRGFLFKPLYNAIQKVFSIETELVVDPKKICLQGAFSNDAINYESNLVGKPEVYILFGKVGSQSKQIDKGSGVVINVPMYQRLKNSFNLVASLWAEDHLIADPSVQNIPNEREKRPVEKTEEEVFLIRGEQFYGFTKTEKVISICGLDYRMHGIDGDPVNVFYTGEDFIVRNSRTANSLQIQPGFFKTNHWVAQTLFPFSEVIKYQDIPVKTLEAEEAPF